MTLSPPIFWILLLFALGGCTKPPMLSTAKNSAEGYEECHAYTEDKNYEKANQCLELLRGRFPGTLQAIEAELETADNYFRQKDYLVAAEAYKGFARLHPAFDRIDYVYYRTGLSYLKESPKAIDRDQQYLDDALHYFSLALNDTQSAYRAVARENWLEARKRLAARTFYVGRHYYRGKEYLAAIPRFQEVVTLYSELGFDEKALYLLGRSYLELGQKERASELLTVFDQHFPKSRYRRKLARRLGTP